MHTNSKQRQTHTHTHTRAHTHTNIYARTQRPRRTSDREFERTNDSTITILSRPWNRSTVDTWGRARVNALPSTCSGARLLCPVRTHACTQAHARARTQDTRTHAHTHLQRGLVRAKQVIQDAQLRPVRANDADLLWRDAARDEPLHLRVRTSGATGTRTHTHGGARPLPPPPPPRARVAAP
jgi:hypothetical protein